MMKKTLSILVVVLSVLTSAVAEAAVSPVSFSLVPPVQFPPSDFTVTGARFSVIYGHHRNFYGVDLGLIGNITDQDFVGLAVAGLFNSVGGNATILGLQAAGGANLNTQKINVYGVQFALGLNSNTAESSVTGVQLAMANISGHTTINGLQVGIYNKARTVNGLQLGLINVTENLRGFQIGLANFHHKGLFVVSPFLNFGF